ncbi:GMC oxidoreductase [Rhizoctonia solani]|uniref:GMC oxidoreductase n=1 Tax=Rhizoctonia solani TaxID=456999 RepID=A0A8H8NN60_9AGAM|nr:GMC oxidoreductase [Rhizoctonia solani]QRW15558.1 GMC oxidoreductase [Rhizoctonia solani]
MRKIDAIYADSIRAQDPKLGKNEFCWGALRSNIVHSPSSAELPEPHRTIGQLTSNPKGVSEGDLLASGALGAWQALPGTKAGVPLRKESEWKTRGDIDALIAAANDVIASYKNVSNLMLAYPNLTSTTIENHVASTVAGSNHWVGSTRLGTNSSTSVVDPNLKVWNTENLYVLDAGSMPSLPAGNPIGAILTMAEMASDKLLALN